MKSCQIVPSLEDRHGGPSRSVLGLATALVEYGETVELLTTNPGPPWEKMAGKLEIRAYCREWPRNICASAGLRAHLHTTTADVVHHHSIWLRTLHYAHKAARRMDAPFVVSPRGMMDPWAWSHHRGRKAFASTFIHHGAFEAVNGWHATSAEESADLRRLGFKQPICVAPNGVSLPLASETEAAKIHWRSILRDQLDRPIALFYSRFHKKKRLLELIDTWLDYGSKDWLLLVVGIPEEYTARMIENYILRSGHSGRVIAYDGAGHPPPYAIASLFLLPSHGENFGLSIAEALANGVPALVTDTTPWKGLNQNGAGWCVPWSDYGAAMLKATSENLEALSLRGSAGREWIRRDYSWAASARLLSDFYLRLRARIGASRP